MRRDVLLVVPLVLGLGSLAYLLLRPPAPDAPLPTSESPHSPGGEPAPPRVEPATAPDEAPTTSAEGDGAAAARDLLERDLAARLARFGGLEGRILDEDGTPWSGPVTIQARFVGLAAGGVAAVTIAGGSTRRVTSETPDGTFRLPRLHPGTWHVEVVEAKDRVQAGTGEDLAVQDGATSGPVSLRLVAPARVVGSVLDDATGSPVPGATVTLQLQGPPGSGGVPFTEARVGDDGRFRADGLAAGSWFLRARSAAGAYGIARIEARTGAEAEAKLRLRAPGVRGPPGGGGCFTQPAPPRRVASRSACATAKGRAWRASSSS
jgi:nitrogen fixation protein FixH